VFLKCEKYKEAQDSFLELCDYKNVMSLMKKLKQDEDAMYQLISDTLLEKYKTVESAKILINYMKKVESGILLLSEKLHWKDAVE
jgi:hypothetical protein